MSEERYTPTRLEWLVLSMQARIPMLLSQVRMLNKIEGADDLRVFFEAREPDTIRVVVRHLEGIDGGLVAILDDQISKEITTIAGNHGWADWVKTEFDVP